MATAHFAVINWGDERVVEKLIELPLQEKKEELVLLVLLFSFFLKEGNEMQIQ